jgi:hypothetical protein
MACFHTCLDANRGRCGRPRSGEGQYEKDVVVFRVDGPFKPVQGPFSFIRGCQEARQDPVPFERPAIRPNPKEKWANRCSLSVAASSDRAGSARSRLITVFSRCPDHCSNEVTDNAIDAPRDTRSIGAMARPGTAMHVTVFRETRRYASKRRIGRWGSCGVLCRGWWRAGF